MYRNHFLRYEELSRGKEISRSNGFLLERSISLQDALNSMQRNNLETQLHPLRLNVADTGRYNHRMGIRIDLLCDFCQVEDTMFHLLLDCAKYSDHRNELLRSLSAIIKTPLDLALLLRLWKGGVESGALQFL